MFRLVNAKNLYSNNFYSNISSSVGHTLGSNNSQFDRISCSFCRKVLIAQPYLENFAHVRHQSTRTAASQDRLSKKKIKYKKPRKYVELLEVNEKCTTETKASISNLKPSHLSKLATSTVSLGELHQLTTKIKIKPKELSRDTSSEVDYDLLKSIEDQIKKQYAEKNVDNIHLEDDKCALIFCNDNIATDLYDTFKNRSYIDMVKSSYTQFKQSTFVDQRFKDLNSAINEGLRQSCDSNVTNDYSNKEKGPHELFRELLKEYRQTYQVDNYEHHELIDDLQSSNLHLSSLNEMYEDELHDDVHETCEDIDLDQEHNDKNVQPKPLNVSKSKSKHKKKQVQQKKQQQREQAMKRTGQEIELRNKQETLNELLTVHLQLHCSLGMLDKGKQILLHYRSKGKRKLDSPKVTSAKVYGVLLHGYALQGNFNVVKELLSYMREDNIDLTIDIYNAVFECIERSNNINDKLKVLNIYYNEIKSKNWSLNDLLDKGKFIKDKRDVIQSAIRKLQPEFTPKYTPPKLDYNCTLLNYLNETENKIGLNVSPIKGLMSIDELKFRARQQLDNEIKGEIMVDNIEVTGEPNKNVLCFRHKYEEMEQRWRKSIKEAFIRNLSTLKSQSNASHNAITIYPYLNVLEVDHFVELIIREVRSLADGSETYSPSLRILQRELGYKVYGRYQIEEKRRNGVLAKIEKIYDKYCEWFVNRESSSPGGHYYNSRQMWQTLIHQHNDGVSIDYEESMWPTSICENVGKFLYKIILNDVKIDVNVLNTKSSKPKYLCAAYCVHRSCGLRNRVEVKPHPVWTKAVRLGRPPQLPLSAPLAPSLCPPVPRCNAAPSAHGGYLLAITPLIRIPSSVTLQWKRMSETAQQQMYPALDSLNQLSTVPWAVNKPILDILLQVFRSGGSKVLNIARPPSALDMSEFNQITSASGNAKATAFRRKLAINRAKAEMYSLWCDTLYKLSLANHYRDMIFWLPHNMDFRGRVYALPPHLSVLGADAARATLLFASKKPLGKGGLDWLLLHAINLTGHHKNSTVEQRIQYAKEIIDKIIDSAENPLNGRKWWVKSDDPWQTLACCMEISNAIKSGSPETYESGFPIHQDGSCNGLQHYAALGADAGGAAAVNLDKRPVPQDVYTAVATLVEEMRLRDASNGVKPALMLEGRVKRKVIKQTVMTTVYGVTKFGARLQIAKQLKDLDDFPRNQVWPCSMYLTSKTFESLRTMFTSTKEIQDWFTECARLISGVCGESVEWVTPLGMPIVQPYYRRRKNTTQTHYTTQEVQRPCTMKQKNAFPPNFIHSLDASHMMLTSLGCEAAGITYASVHDCFWTHVQTVSIMNRICREQFVALHSQPILDDLSQFMLNKYGYKNVEISENSTSTAKKKVNSLLKQVPEKGKFDISNVLESVYFFS